MILLCRRGREREEFREPVVTEMCRIEFESRGRCVEKVSEIFIRVHVHLQLSANLHICRMKLLRGQTETTPIEQFPELRQCSSMFKFHPAMLDLIEHIGHYKDPRKVNA